MDTPPPTSDMHAPAGFVTVTDPRRTELLLDALKTALAEAGEHRLFARGKIPGLFPARAGLPAEAALQAIREGLLETVRTETKGKLVTEWVIATPKAVSFIHEHDSLRAILRELKLVLDTTRDGVPAFLSEAKAELALLSANFQAKATAMLARLDDLARRCESALRRAETTGSAVAEPVSRVVPWAMEALKYLDQRTDTGAKEPCTLPELFHALRAHFPDLTLSAFHDGVKRLYDLRAVRLLPGELAEPEYAVVLGGKLMYLIAH